MIGRERFILGTGFRLTWKVPLCPPYRYAASAEWEGLDKCWRLSMQPLGQGVHDERDLIELTAKLKKKKKIV